jgi:DNA invertase Pin-like site-specific DNA recombinase
MANPSPSGAHRASAGLRCAVYTRKSSEEGLEQDFNSLHAQREACEAYVSSQRREGWVLLPEMYDDGGFSGGTMERPAFQRLLADVSGGKIDTVVVYKVDRLTRSLSDFAKIVDVFDRHGVSFVSVTQQFNTTTSMGRLTLNMLLSFAQFEREVTGERIRDKIAASKKKGMWMGGMPPLGYDVKDRKLVVNEIEAETVRSTFRRYVELKSVRVLKADLDAIGILSKDRTAPDGSRYGGKPLARGALYLMLQNRIYRGEIVHKDKGYPGVHEAIVDEALWSKVQKILSTNRIEQSLGLTDKEPSLLSGVVFDAGGKRMSPSHASKRGIRYRYYVSRSLLDGSANDPTGGQRIPAIALEGLVTRRIGALLADPGAILDLIKGGMPNADGQKQAVQRAKDQAANWQEPASDEMRAFLRSIVTRVQLHADRIDISVDQARLTRWLNGTRDRVDSTAQNLAVGDPRWMTLTVPAHLRRAGKEMKIVVDDGSEPAVPDASLVRVLVRAHVIRQRLLDDRTLTLEEVAKSEGMVPSYGTRLYRLTLLAPDIASAIFSGTQPPELTARKLMDDTRLPLDWGEQRRNLGFR